MAIERLVDCQWIGGWMEGERDGLAVSDSEGHADAGTEREREIDRRKDSWLEGSVGVGDLGDASRVSLEPVR